MGTASVIVGGSSGKHFLRPYTTVMKTPVVLIVILGVITSSAVAQTTDLNVTSNESNYTEVPVEEPVMEPEALPMDFSGAMAASLVYAQQEYYALYATVLLELQASYAWLHVSEGMANMATASVGGRADPSGFMSFEEGATDIENHLSGGATSFLEEDQFSGMAELVERQTEQSLLQLVKLMYVQAAHRLGSAQELHYRNKVVLLQLAPFAQISPAVGQLIYVLYYRDMVELIISAITLQKQDAWNTWVFHEMMETELFLDGAVPSSFQRRMAFARRQAMGQFQTQAGLELAAVVLEYHTTSLQQDIVGAAFQNQRMAQMSQATMQADQSFLEVESQAQFVPSMALGGFFGWQEFLPYVKFYTAWIKYHVSSSLALLSHVDALATVGKDQGHSKHTPYLMAHQVMPMLKQWTQLRLMLALYDFYAATGAIDAGRMAGTAAHHHNTAASNAAAFSNLVQQHAETTSLMSSPENDVNAKTPEAPVQTPAQTGQHEILKSVDHEKAQSPVVAADGEAQVATNEPSVVG